MAPLTLLQWAVKLLAVISVAASAVGGAGVAVGVDVAVGVGVGVGGTVGVVVGVGLGVGERCPCPRGVGVGVKVGVAVGGGIVAQSPGPAVLSTKPETVPLKGEEVVFPVAFTTTTKLWPAGTVNE